MTCTITRITQAGRGEIPRQGESDMDEAPAEPQRACGGNSPLSGSQQKVSLQLIFGQEMRAFLTLVLSSAFSFNNVNVTIFLFFR